MCGCTVRDTRISRYGSACVHVYLCASVVPSAGSVIHTPEDICAGPERRKATKSSDASRREARGGSSGPGQIPTPFSFRAVTRRSPGHLCSGGGWAGASVERPNRGRWSSWGRRAAIATLRAPSAVPRPTVEGLLGPDREPPLSPVGRCPCGEVSLWQRPGEGPRWLGSERPPDPPPETANPRSLPTRHWLPADTGLPLGSLRRLREQRERRGRERTGRGDLVTAGDLPPTRAADGKPLPPRTSPDARAGASRRRGGGLRAGSRPTPRRRRPPPRPARAPAPAARTGRPPSSAPPPATASLSGSPPPPPLPPPPPAHRHARTPRVRAAVAGQTSPATLLLSTSPPPRRSRRARRLGRPGPCPLGSPSGRGTAQAPRPRARGPA